MRAVKSVLTMAGSLKRKNLQKSEDQVLLKAMKDSNLPKFSLQDIPLFEGIIKDLFPTLTEIEEKNEVLEESIKKCLIQSHLFPCTKIVQKAIQLYEISCIRHGIMVIGSAGTGKTTILNTLIESLKEQNDVVKLYKLNPKSLTRKELFGFTDPITGSFIPGVVSKVITPAMEATDTNKKWFMFDGPVDADWIENLNTVLDDNKMLCLPDGKRIKLPNYFSFLFEVDDLEQASPATVSRCGMIFMDNDTLNPMLYFEPWQAKFIATVLGENESKDYLKPVVSLLVSPEYLGFLKELLKKTWEIYKQQGSELIPSISLSLIQNCLQCFQILAL